MPGSIDADLLRTYHSRIAGVRGVPVDTVHAEAGGRVVLKTISTAEEVAYLALFLAFDQAPTITIQSIIVDAGFSMPG